MTNEERAREAAEKIYHISWLAPDRHQRGKDIILAALDAATASLVAERERLRGVLKNIRDYGELANVSADSGFGYRGGKKSPSKDVWQFPRHLLADLDAALAEKEPG